MQPARLLVNVTGLTRIMAPARPVLVALVGLMGSCGEPVN